MPCGAITTSPVYTVSSKLIKHDIKRLDLSFLENKVKKWFGKKRISVL